MHEIASNMGSEDVLFKSQLLVRAQNINESS